MSVDSDACRRQLDHLRARDEGAPAGSDRPQLGDRFAVAMTKLSPAATASITFAFWLRSSRCGMVFAIRAL
jgi:hypothetical protein